MHTYYQYIVCHFAVRACLVCTACAKLELNGPDGTDLACPDQCWRLPQHHGRQSRLSRRDSRLFTVPAGAALLRNARTFQDWTPKFPAWTRSLPSPEHVSESLKTPVPAIIGPLRDRHLRGRTDEKVSPGQPSAGLRATIVMYLELYYKCMHSCPHIRSLDISNGSKF